VPGSNRRPGFEHIVNKTDFPDTGYRLAAWYGNPTGNAIELFDSQGIQHIVDDGELPLVGSWTHVAAVWDGATISLYRNGELTGSAPFTGSISPSTNDLFIGVNPVLGKQGYFVGRIDEVAIYDRALSPAEIRALAPEPELLALLVSGLAAALCAQRSTRLANQRTASSSTSRAPRGE